MSDLDINEVVDQLARTTVADEGKEIDFSGKALKLDTEDDAKDIVNEIVNCKSLRSLKLEGNTLGIAAAKAIAKALETHPEFQRAKWKDMFTGRMKSEIPEALRYLGGGLALSAAKLVELDLSDNALGPIGMEGLTVMLKSPTCYTLQELRLNNIGLGITGGKMLAESLLYNHKQSAALGTPLSLKVFISGRNRLENVGATTLANVFEVMGSLEEVQLPQNGIYHAGITALAKAFAKNKKLRILNMNDNTFTEKGAASMAKALPHLQNLEVVNFGDCLVRSEGAKLIAKALRGGHQNLKELHLGFNEINKAGAMEIAESLEDKQSLELLDLDGNRLGEEGCDVVRATLESFEKAGALGTLSEDEGDEEDEDEDEEDAVASNDEAEDDDDNEEEENGEEIPHKPRYQSPMNLKSPSNQIEAPSNNVSPINIKTISAAEFLNSPSDKKLLNMGTDKANMFLKELGDSASYDSCLHMAIKISSVVTTNDELVKEAACECADKIFERIFVKAEEEDIVPVISNSLLVHLGLIKGEDKKFVPVGNLLGPFIVLEHIVRQPYFSRSTKEFLQHFLSRPNKAVEACGITKHKLMESLYRY